MKLSEICLIVKRLMKLILDWRGPNNSAFPPGLERVSVALQMVPIVIALGELERGKIKDGVWYKTALKFHCVVPTSLNNVLIRCS